MSSMAVFGDHEIDALMFSPPSERFDAMANAFASATGHDELNQMLVVDSATQLPDDLLMLTDRMRKHFPGLPRKPVANLRLMQYRRYLDLAQNVHSFDRMIKLGFSEFVGCRPSRSCSKRARGAMPL